MNPPLPDQYFTGRDKELREYINQLKDTKTRAIVIPGLAGVGKSALAEKLLNDLILSHEFSKDEILWAELDADDTIQGWWTSLSEEAQKRQDEETFKILTNKNYNYNLKLNKSIEFLDKKISIIFFDDYHKIIGNEEVEFLIKDLIHLCQKTKFVILSRQEVMKAEYPHLELKGLEDTIGVQLLRKLNNQLQDEDKLLENIVKKCRGHILALRIIAGLLETQTAEEFLNNFKDVEIDLRQLLDNRFANMSDKQRELTVQLSFIRERVSRNFIEFLYSENQHSEIRQIIIEVARIFLLEYDEVEYRGLKGSKRITLIDIHDVIREYCQSIIYARNDWRNKLSLDDAKDYHDRAAKCWMNILRLSKNNQNSSVRLTNKVLNKIQNNNYSFIPEEKFSSKSIDEILLLNNNVVPTLTNLDCLDEAYHHHFESGDYEQSATLLFLIDRYIYRWGMIPQLFERIQQLEDNNAQLTPQLLFRKARILKDLEEAEEALEILKPLQNYDDKIVEAVAYQIGGEAYVLQENYSEAINFYNIALKKFIQEDEAKGKSATYGLLGDAYMKRGEETDLEEALKNYQEAYDLSKSFPYYSCRNLWRIGNVYLAQGKYQEAIEKLDESRKKMERVEQQKLLDESIDLAKLRLDLAKALIGIERKSEAKNYLELARNTFEKQQFYGFEAEAEELLNEIRDV